MWLKTFPSSFMFRSCIEGLLLVKYSSTKGDDHVRSDRDHSERIPVRGVAAPASGDNVTVHHADDRAAGLDHLGRSPGRGRLAAVLGRLPALGAALVLVWVAQRRQEHLSRLPRMGRTGYRSDRRHARIRIGLRSCPARFCAPCCFYSWPLRSPPTSRRRTRPPSAR